MRRKFHPITDLTGGLNLDVDPMLIPEKDSRNILCARFDRGLLKKDLGLTLFGDTLLGVPLRFDSYHQTDGDTFLLALTTTGIFQFNTTSKLWDNITEGETIEDCEDAWLAKANVTCDVSATVYKRGSNSATAVVATAFTTGILCTEVIASADLSGYDHVHFWIKSSIALDAGDLQLLLDDTGACASPIETIDLPALEEDTWTRVSIALAHAASDTAIISIGLNLTANKAAFNLWFDDYRAVKEFTGSADERWSTVTLNDIFIMTNGQDVMKTYNGADVADLGGSPPIAKWVIAFQNRLLVCGTVEGGTDYPQRIRWSSAGTLITWSGGTSGYIDVMDTVDWCTALTLLRDKCFLYKERSIWDVIYIGGSAVFEVKLRIDGIGTLHPETLQSLGEADLFFGSDSIYEFDGFHLEDQGEKVFPLLYETDTKIVDLLYPRRASGLFIEELGEYWLSLPTVTSDGIPDLLLKQSRNKAWVRRNNQNITCLGFYSILSSPTTWAGTSGTWEAKEGTWKRRSLPGYAPTTLVGKSDGTTYEDDRSTGTDEEMVYETKDFIFGHAFRLYEFRMYARYGGFTVSYSPDAGVTWLSEKTFNYSSDWKEHVLFLNRTLLRVRFKISVTALNFDLKWIEVRYIPRQRSKTLVS